MNARLPFDDPRQGYIRAAYAAAGLCAVEYLVDDALRMTRRRTLGGERYLWRKRQVLMALASHAVDARGKGMLHASIADQMRAIVTVTVHVPRAAVVKRKRAALGACALHGLGYEPLEAIETVSDGANKVSEVRRALGELAVIALGNDDGLMHYTRGMIMDKLVTARPILDFDLRFRAAGAPVEK